MHGVSLKNMSSLPIGAIVLVWTRKTKNPSHLIIKVHNQVYSNNHIYNYNTYLSYWERINYPKGQLLYLSQLEKIFLKAKYSLYNPNDFTFKPYFINLLNFIIKKEGKKYHLERYIHTFFKSFNKIYGNILQTKENLCIIPKPYGVQLKVQGDKKLITYEKHNKISKDLNDDVNYLLGLHLALK